MATAYCVGALAWWRWHTRVGAQVFSSAAALPCLVRGKTQPLQASLHPGHSAAASQVISTNTADAEARQKAAQEKEEALKEQSAQIEVLHRRGLQRPGHAAANPGGCATRAC